MQRKLKRARNLNARNKKEVAMLEEEIEFLQGQLACTETILKLLFEIVVPMSKGKKYTGDLGTTIVDSLRVLDPNTVASEKMSAAWVRGFVLCRDSLAGHVSQNLLDPPDA